MNKKIMIGAVVVLIVVALAYSTISKSDKAAATEQLKQTVAQGTVLIDVRTVEEYNEGHIPGSINIPVETIHDGIAKHVPDKNTPVVLYCRSGSRSAVATKALEGVGYTSVENFGGINKWIDELE